MATTNTLSDPPSGLDDATNAAGEVAKALNALTSAVTGVGTLIKSLSDLLPNETRSTIVEIDNLTSHPLTKKTDNFDSGGFGPTLPKGQIAPFSTDVFTADSDGVATGVVGSLTYTVEGVGDFLVNNPFVGSNAVNASTDRNVDPLIAVLGEKSDGNHNHARFAIVEKTDPKPGGQADWRACSKCQGMFFDGFQGKGVCPKGDGHDSSGSFAYMMIFNSKPSSHVQVGWAACPNCQGMHFGAGRCPAGGQHVQTNSFGYAQLFNLDPTDHIQLDWAACPNCQGLFFGPNGGVCPAGGAHQTTNSFNYGTRFL